MDKRAIKEGIKDGSPIFLGYFTTALAFGLLTRSSGFTFVEGVLTSLTNFAGSGQFLMINLYNGGAFLLEIVLSVFFINARYIFMSASLNQRLKDTKSIIGRFFVGAGTVDEAFAVASFKGEKLSYSYLIALMLTSYSGWVSGTAIGYLVGNILPEIVQHAALITIYAMFASLFGNEVSRNVKAIAVVGISAALNSLFILGFDLSTGLSFIISMIISVIFACFIYTDEEVFDNE